MAPYFILVIFVSVLFYLDYKYTPKSGWIRIIALLAVICFAGFRYKICYDYLNYAGYYIEPSIFVGEVEWFFLLFIKFIKLLGISEQGMFFICSAITYILLYKSFVKLTDNYRVSLLIYLLIPGLFLNSFTLIRQSIAMSCLLYGYTFLRDGKYRPFIIFAALAFLVHNSSIVIIFLYLFSLLNWTKNIFLLSFIIIPITIVIGQTLNVADIVISTVASEDSKYNFYRNSNYELGVIKLVLTNVIFLLYLYVYHTRMDKNENKYLSLLLMSVVFTNLFSKSPYVSRFAYFFTLFEPIVAAGVIYKIKKMERIMALSILTIYFIFLFYNALYTDATLDISTKEKKEKLVPYKSIFNKENAKR